MSSPANPYIEKPHLEGSSFVWPGGPRGVLLLHGLSATTAEVRPLAAALHAAGYTVSGPLLPGHFTHPADLNRTHRRDWIETVASAYHNLQQNCDWIAVGGESTGAVLSLNLALDHPEIAGLLLYAPALRLRLSSLEMLVLRLAAPFVPWVKPRSGGPDLQWQGYTVRATKGILQLVALSKTVRSRLAEIHQPLLVIQGRLDPTVHNEVPALIASNVSSRIKAVHWLDHSTHCVLLDREADQAFQLTLDFLEQL